MELLDTRTLLFTITALLMARAGVLAFVWRYIRHYAPAGYWTAGSMLIAIGALLAGLREIAPAGVSILLAQICIGSGWMLIDAGIVLAADHRVPWRVGIGLCVLMVLPLTWFTFGNPDYVWRTVVTTIPQILFDTYALVACLRGGGRRRVGALRLLAATLGVMAASNAWKMVGAAAQQTTSLLQVNPPLVQFLLVSMLSFIVGTALFVLLAAQELQEELDRELAVRKQNEAELQRHRDDLAGLVRERTAELEERSARLAQTEFAMDRAGIGVAWNDVDTGNFIYANAETCRQLGYTRDELLDLSISDINPDFPPSLVRELAIRLQEQNGSLRVETTHHRQDGTTYPVEVTAYLNRVDGREWFIAFFKDITARKAGETALITAKEAAEAASRAKDAFLSNMGHELRTPMNAIMGMSFLARHDTNDPTLHGHLDEIDTAAAHLLHIINQVLDVAQIESERLELRPAEFCLPEVLQAMERLSAEALAKKGLGLRVEIPESLAIMTLVGDARRIGQILESLVDNAIKFTEHGSVTVKLEGRQDDGERILLHVEVIDTGIGIRPEDRQKLFHAFEQVDMSRTRKHGGTGIGLALSQRLARLMGGDLGVSSVPGAGSTFWFNVPLQRG